MTISLTKYYRTTNGNLVSLYTVTGKGSFPVKGSIYKPHKGYHKDPEYQIWTSTGNALPLGTHPSDLIEVTESEFMLLLGDNS